MLEQLKVFLCGSAPELEKAFKEMEAGKEKELPPPKDQLAIAA